jgi:RNA polymerase subunit RPABC4/transcription elongation factor Spt4
MRGRTIQALCRSVLLLFVMMSILTLVCAQANALQMVNLPKYDIGLTLTPDTVNAGDKVHVTSHVTLLYYQMGTDPSVPNINVAFELKGTEGTISTTYGMTDKRGSQTVEITVPTAGDYTIIVRAYDIAGGPVNGQNEIHVTVKPASAVTATPAPVTPTPPTITKVPPTAVPPTATPKTGGFSLGTTELMIIGGAILVLLLILLVAAALLAFFLLRRRKKPTPVKPAEPVPAPAPAVPSSRFCMHCGAAMSLDASKCPKCGLTPPSGVDTKQCSNCNTVVPESAKFCYYCGVAQPETAKK